ncbi:hypothetical protein EVAR_99481_1 [Eumeta japonica]|uniref:Uncharacterized protein n=1 Tax=Eumeta variegata TaxID=151549 RepID=A0A4C1ZSW7_EUMVA|nr:hypothetical protein EVAR_99481_1 [Eumeta japonica]
MKPRQEAVQAHMLEGMLRAEALFGSNSVQIKTVSGSGIDITNKMRESSHPYCKTLRNSIGHHIRLRQLLDRNDVTVELNQIEMGPHRKHQLSNEERNQNVHPVESSEGKPDVLSGSGQCIAPGICWSFEGGRPLGHPPSLEYKRTRAKLTE